MLTLTCPCRRTLAGFLRRLDQPAFPVGRYVNGKPVFTATVPLTVDLTTPAPSSVTVTT